MFMFVFFTFLGRRDSGGHFATDCIQKLGGSQSRPGKSVQYSYEVSNDPIALFDRSH